MLRLSPLFLLAAVFAALPTGAATANSRIEFNRDIRPILSENCFPCHGADSAARKAGLRLDRFEEAIAPRKDSPPAIVPGKPEASELVRRITAADPDDIMPPAKTHKVLRAEQKELLKSWIAASARFEPHWSLIPPKRPELPKVQNQRWPRNPVDYFVLAPMRRGEQAVHHLLVGVRRAIAYEGLDLLR